MPFKLASEQFRGPSGGGGLRPSLLPAGGGVSGLRAGRINPNAANVKFTPMPIEQLQPDPSLKAAQQFADIWAAEAFKFRDKEDTATANAGVLQAETNFRAAWYGTEDSEGFSTSQGEVSVKGFGGYQQKLAEVMGGSVENMSPSVKAKALPAIQNLRDKYLDRGAAHKATQLGVWQRNLEQAKVDSVKRAIRTESGNPEIFGSTMAEYIGELERTYAGRPEALAVEKQKFINGIMSDVIDTHTKNGNFGLAAVYLDKADQIGTDPQLIAVKRTQYATAMTAANNVAERVEVANAKTVEADTAKINQRITSRAITTNDPALLGLIVDPNDQAKAMNTMSTIQRGVPSNREDLANMQSQRPSLRANPERIWDEDFFPSVVYDDKKLMYDTLVKDERLKLTAAKNQAEAWVETVVLAPATKTPTVVNAYKAKKRALLTTLENAINATEGTNQAPEAAMYETAAKLMQDPYTSAMITIPKESLVPVDGLLEGGMLGLDSLEGTGMAPELYAVKVAESYIASAYQLKLMYGIVPDDIVSLAKVLAADQVLRRQYMVDANMLYMQQMYYRKKAEGQLKNQPVVEPTEMP